MIGAANWVGRTVPFHPAANGKVFLAFGAAELPPGELTRFTPHTICDREHLTARSTRFARSATRRPSTRSRSGSRPSPPPCAAPPAPASPPSRSPARASASGRASSTTWVPCSSSRPPSSPPDSGTPPWSEDDHDARRDPAGTVRQHADRQQARGRRPRQPGPRGGHGAELDAVRRAHPVARGGRRALRARRLLRARDADRRPRDAGRARHPAPAAGRRGRAADRHVRDGHRQGRRARHRQEPRQHHARGRRLHGHRPRRERPAGELHRADRGAQARDRRLLGVPHDDDADVQGQHQRHREGRPARQGHHHGRRRARHPGVRRRRRRRRLRGRRLHRGAPGQGPDREEAGARPA